MEQDASKIRAWYMAKAAEFNSLWKRMDEDLEIWEMNPSPSNITDYESAVKTKTKRHGSDIDLVSNDLRTNCDNIQSILSSADMQIMVKMAEAEGIDKQADIGRLERLFYFMLEQGDLRLSRLLLPSLRESSDWHALVRGWRAARILNYKVGEGEIIANYTALDPRWLVYEIGGKGLLKVGYKTFKSQAALKDEWGFDEGKKTDNEIIDYWEYEGKGKVGNAVTFQGRFLKDPEILKMRSMPFSIIPVAIRPPIADSSGTKLKSYGESIFASARNIHAVRNRFAAIVINHANLMANQALINYRTPEGEDITTLTNVPGGVVNVPMYENRIEPSPQKDISPTVVSIMSWLSSQVESTLLPRFQVEEPPASGTRYGLAQEASNKIFNPQLRSLNHFYEEICRLIEEQLIDGGITVKFESLLKNKYEKVKVTPVDLKKEHIIKVESTARNPWEQLNTAQQGQMLEALGLPQVWIWENILKLQDPKLIRDLVALEVYQHSPQGMMKAAVEVLMDKGYEFEASKLAEQMDRMETEDRMRVPPPPPGMEGLGVAGAGI